MKDLKSADFDLGLTATVGVDADGVSLSIPIEFNADGTVTEDVVHIKMDYNLSLAGESQSGSYEMYAEKNTDEGTYETYTREDDDEYWNYEVSDIDEDDDEIAGIDTSEVTDILNDESLFADSTLETSDTGYVLIQPITSFLNSNKVDDFLDDEVNTASTEITTDDLKSYLEGINVTYTFDKDYYLTSLAIEDCKDSFDYDGSTVTYEIALKANLSNFNNASVTIPDSVKDNATVETEIVDDPNDADADDSFGGFGEDADFFVDDDTDTTSSSSSTNTLESVDNVTIIDFNDTVCGTVNVPTGFYLESDYCEQTDDLVILGDDNYNTIYVEYDMDYLIEEYLKNGSIADDEDFGISYTVTEIEDYENGTYPALLVRIDKSYTDYDWTATEWYATLQTDNGYISIEFDLDSDSNWTDDSVVELLHQMLQ
jgi:hypothetical protein